jgi:simple sugar transport system permease protein
MIVFIGTMNPAFFSLANAFDLMKSSVVMGLLGIGVLLVLVSGGIDISFTAVAAFSMYVTCRILVAADYSGSVLVAFVLAGALGAGLGLVNAVFISWFRLPTLIVTLGTASLFRGFLLAFIGTAIINNLPPGLVRFSRWTIFSERLPSGETIGLSVSFFLLVLVAVAAWVFLRYTLAGRGIFAMGGNLEAAERAGFNLTGLRFLIYGVVGCLSGVAGIVHASMMRNANPFDLLGTELTVIAAVVLGGASITGGTGSVLGTLLGVGMMITINNSLILLQIPSYWQRVAVGLIIIASTGVAALKRTIRKQEVVLG